MNANDQRSNMIPEINSQRKNKTYRKSQSYTDIYSQISGDSSRKWKESRTPRRLVKNVLTTNKVDYEFLRHALGIRNKVGERKSTFNERFLTEELKEAVLKLRREARNLKMEIKDENWLKTLEDLGDISEMEEDLLEAIYFLRNAYKKGLFSSAPCIQTLDFESIVNTNDKDKRNLLVNGQDLTLSPPNRCPSPMSSASHVSSDYSSDMESTSSSVVVKRRPARPRIDLSSASLSEIIPKEDDFLFLHPEDRVLTSEKNVMISGDSIQCSGLENDVGRPGSADSSTSYLNVVDDHALQRGSDEDQIDAKKEFINNSFQGNNTSDVSVDNNARLYEEFRSESPTSRLLRPLFQYTMSEEIYKTVQSIRSKLSPKLGRLENLENDSKLLPVLQVKLAVLQEEKRQLMNIIKQKRNAKQSTTSYISSNSSSPLLSRGSSPTSFISDTEDSYLLRPFPRRVTFNKETQTDRTDSLFNWVICPYCQTKALDNTEGMRGEDIKANVASKYNNKYKNLPPKMNQQIVNSEIMLCETTDKKPLENNMLTSTGVQCCVSTRDHSTTTVSKTSTTVGVGHENDVSYFKDVSTETMKNSLANKAVGMEPCGSHLSDFGVQKSVDITDKSTEIDRTVYCDKNLITDSVNMKTVGLQCSPTTKDAFFGDQSAVIISHDCETQNSIQLHDNETQTHYEAVDKSVTCGCGIFQRRSIGTSSAVSYSDFECGNAPAIIYSKSIACQAAVDNRNVALDAFDTVDRKDFSMHCNLDFKNSVTTGFGDHTVNDLLCDSCSNRELISIGVGSYNPKVHEHWSSNDDLCRIDDKLCTCRRVESSEIAVGDTSVHDVVCDKCKGKTSKTVACSEDRTDILPCDICDKVTKKTIGCGDFDIATIICDQCNAKSNMVDIGVGDGDIFESHCETHGEISTRIYVSSSDVINPEACNGDSITKETGNDDGDIDGVCDEVNKILTNASLSQIYEGNTILCNNCGSKVNLNDSNLEGELLGMESEINVFGANRLGVNRDIDDFSVSDENINLVSNNDNDSEDVSDDDDDDGFDERTRNDIVESCKMLQFHFSGEKPLKQQLMMKYLANIEALWFSAVKRKRANAAVVKSYIELFQSRIPELVDTIINLTDADGNTALHFALTYKNTSAVSILLDTNECQIDLVNKAGYSPIMLAALAGFDNKTDKYVMQRLIRSGNVNCKNQETGQTPLMLAVNRGNVGMVELLLDAGANVNETDNDGSTALMCACENGNMPTVKALLSSPDCDATIEDHEGSTALSIAMDAKRRDLALLIYGSLNFDMRGRIKLTPSRQSLLGLGARRSPSPVIGKT